MQQKLNVKFHLLSSEQTSLQSTGINQTTVSIKQAYFYEEKKKKCPAVIY